VHRHTVGALTNVYGDVLPPWLSAPRQGNLSENRQPYYGALEAADESLSSGTFDLGKLEQMPFRDAKPTTSCGT
jgi:hypothetical protein